MATIEQQVKDLKKEKDYCCTQITYQLAGLARSLAVPWCWHFILMTRKR